MTFKEKCIHFIKQETVLAVATMLAVAAIIL